ncbi:UPF0182 family protein [Tsukamurella sp. 8F]|uniref:UPF0182 family membrane protein n=1 Tax=unclassified Tsukamurella TaxID=2633480 RepID=UPI0023B9547E|nr:MULTISPECIES: UPF0182 family protein [unclassified Tsukamurella]MDF0528881.1 UPF0182 family protein [Tsukamurella sp. 8J]MDF0586716.1 UPF0182 family protein [Tsukamurella sp. 8F]
MTTRASGSIPSLSRRAKILIAVAVVVLAVLLIGPRFVDLYTNFLLFGSLGHSSVLRTVVLTRIVLFLITGLLMGLFTFVGLWLAHRVRPAFVPSATDDPVVRYRAVVMSRIKTFALVPTLLVAVIAGIFGQAAWRTVQLFLHRVPFGTDDPQFGKDIGFYAFTLPFIQLVLGFLFAALIIMFLSNLLAHYVFGGIRLAGREGALSRGARIQLASIAGAFLLTKAAAYWYDRYELVYSDRSRMFTGAGYADIHAVLPAKAILTGIAIICAGAFFAGIVLRDLRVPAIATVLMLFSSVIVGFGWPQAVQYFTVNPSIEKETAYIQRNLDGTKAAYGLSKVDYVREFGKGTKAQLQTITAADSASLQNVRLLDPSVVSDAFRKRNELKQFYAVPNQLAVDRYDTDGKLTNYLVAAVELDPDNTPNDWANRHLVYTHGNGLLSAPAGQVDEVLTGADQASTGSSGGLPVMATNTIGKDVKVTQPRIYFGEVIGSDPSFYSIVGGAGGPREYDNDNDHTTYAGTGGVSIGSWPRRLAYAIKFGERNLLFNRDIDAQSRIIYQRDPRDRVRQVAPFLTTDTKTYPVVDQKTGHIVWVVDGYTTLPKYPYAQQTSLQNATAEPGIRQQQGQSTAGQNGLPANARTQPDEKIGYIRNSVKATVDAYDGTVHLYQVDDHDPVLNAWKNVFPGVVQPRSEIPQSIADHLRYPENLFEVQRVLMQKYHTDDPTSYRQGNNLWQLSTSPEDTPDQGGPQAPYYSVASGPQSGTAYFQLSSLLQARDQDYLAAQMSVSSSTATYGQITVREFARGSGLVDGPRQAAGRMDASGPVTADRANINAIKPQYGNMQAIPLQEGGMVYVRPMYTDSGNQDPPKLIKVLVLNPVTGAAGYQPTVAAALKQAGYQGVDAALSSAAKGVAEAPGAAAPSGGNPESSSGNEATVPGPGTGSGDSQAVTTAAQAVTKAWGDVVAAQKAGDQAAVGDAMARLGDAVSKLQAAEQAQQPK